MTTSLSNSETKPATPSWLNNWTGQIGRILSRSGQGVRLMPDCTLDLNDASLEEIIKAGNQLLGLGRQSSASTKLINLMLGQAIIAYSAHKECDWSEAISDMDLCEKTGKAYKTLMKLPRIVSRIPHNIATLPGLTITHLDAALSVKEPSDLAEQQEFQRRREEILVQAAEDPDEKNKAWITSCLRDALPESEKKKKERRKPTKELHDELERYAVILLEWTKEEIEQHNTTVGEIRDRYTSIRDQLIDLGEIDDSILCPDEFVPFWAPPKIIDITDHGNNESDTGDAGQDGIPDCQEDETQGEE